MTKDLKKWMPMFWADYFRGTQEFTNATEHGAYLLLIAYCWNKGALPKDDDARRRIAKCTSRQWALVSQRLNAKFDSEGRNERCDEELAHAIEKSNTMSANAKVRYSNGKAKADTPTPTPTKKEGIGEKKQNWTGRKEDFREGFKAPPDSPEFMAWKAWAFTHNVPLWRELQKRELEGRGFDFETRLPQ